MRDYKLKLGVTRLVYTGLAVELEHLKIETRLTIDKFASAMGEYVTDMRGAPAILIRKNVIFFFPSCPPECPPECPVNTHSPFEIRRCCWNAAGTGKETRTW
jgi:hypothetical protein